MLRRHNHCEACSHGQGAHDHSHDRYNQLVEAFGVSLEGKIATYVIQALKSQSDEAFQAMLGLMQEDPFAFVNELNIPNQDQ